MKMSQVVKNRPSQRTHFAVRTPVSSDPAKNQCSASSKRLVAIVTLALVFVAPSFTFAQATTEEEYCIEVPVFEMYGFSNNERLAYDIDPSLMTIYDDQSATDEDLEIQAQIRSEIIASNDLSAAAKNITITARNNTVLLRGGVVSAREKAWILELTRDVASGYEIVDELQALDVGDW